MLPSHVKPTRSSDRESDRSIENLLRVGPNENLRFIGQVSVLGKYLGRNRNFFLNLDRKGKSPWKSKNCQNNKGELNHQYEHLID